MDSAMIGVGVGFDTKGSHLNLHLHRPLPAAPPHEIPDTREGWVDSLRLLLASYLYPARPHAVFDYSKIRPPGVPLKTFGGQSSGPGPLIDMHRLLEKRFSDKLNKDRDRSQVTSRDIVDIMNIIGRCVIAGNIRRVAEIALGEAQDSEFIQLKDYEKNPDRMDYGWVSNNSIYAELGMDYTEVQESILKNGGEPGLCWLENMRAYGRMIEPPNYRDKKAAGGNPCLEQTLESNEMCCLVETFPMNHASYEDYQETL
jgi:ribonucleoside-triphosphate reductase (thioredoxin)